MKAILVLIVFTAAAQASPVPSGRIIGGEAAASGQFPYQLSLQETLILGIYNHICGASVLTPNWALTAGHCVYQSTTQKKVVGGITSLLDESSNRQEAAVAVAIVHPSFAGGVGPYDIAVLQLATSLSYTPYVQPSTLPAANTAPSGGVTLSGWGDIATIGPVGVPTTELQYANMTLISYEECYNLTAELIGSNPLSETSNVCTSNADGTASCNGDSGGPLVTQGTTTVVGLVSWGPSTCVGEASVYTNVSYFVPWIQENVPNLSL